MVSAALCFAGGKHENIKKNHTHTEQPEQSIKKKEWNVKKKNKKNKAEFHSLCVA